jgi:hypothetical protein
MTRLVLSHSRYPLLLLAFLVVSFDPWSHAAPGKNQKSAADKDYAAELPYIPPKSPAESLKAFRLHPDFRIELAAAEPHLASPVALDFDEDGRLYAVDAQATPPVSY